MKFGIDLGGTKIESIALDDVGTELLRRRLPTLAPLRIYHIFSCQIAGIMIKAVQ